MTATPSDTPIRVVRRLAKRTLGWVGFDPDDVRYGKLPKDADYGQPIDDADAGNTLIGDLIIGRQPLLVGRLGGTETLVLDYHSRWRRPPLRWPYPEPRRTMTRDLSGFFPSSDNNLDRFAEIYLSALSAVDVLGVWGLRNEHTLIRRHCPCAHLVRLESLDAITFDAPWSARLAARRVLVIHPFAATIRSQYERRERLFRNRDTLPEFELLTLRAVQSLGGRAHGFATWFDALDAMTDSMAAEDFDLAIIGAGAYGLPLAAAAKRLGRQAIHMGGVTQMLFGIVGKRWETEHRARFRHLVNEYWVRPSPEETPDTAAEVEGGCYW